MQVFRRAQGYAALRDCINPGLARWLDPRRRANDTWAVVEPGELLLDSGCRRCGRAMTGTEYCKYSCAVVVCKIYVLVLEQFPFSNGQPVWYTGYSGYPVCVGRRIAALSVVSVAEAHVAAPPRLSCDAAAELELQASAKDGRTTVDGDLARGGKSAADISMGVMRTCAACPTRFGTWCRVRTPSFTTSTQRRRSRSPQRSSISMIRNRLS